MRVNFDFNELSSKEYYTLTNKVGAFMVDDDLYLGLNHTGCKEFLNKYGLLDSLPEGVKIKELSGTQAVAYAGFHRDESKLAILLALSEEMQESGCPELAAKLLALAAMMRINRYGFYNEAGKQIFGGCL